MNQYKINKIRYFIIGITILFSDAVFAQNLDDVKEAAQASMRAGVASQQRVDQLDDETGELIRKFRAAQSQLTALQEYNDQLEKLIISQENEMVSVRAQIEKATNIDRAIVPLMFNMIAGLEKFISLDVPFLKPEREARVQNLHALMKRADANQAEKFRKILEAYEIENEYGRTIEAYEATMDIKGEERMVTFLRIGRVALIYQSLDGEESGAWSQSKQEFVDLDGEFDGELRAALRVAKQQAAPDLLVVPVVLSE